MLKLIKELDLTGTHELGFQGQSMYAISPGHIKAYRMEDYQLTREQDIKGNTQPGYISQEFLISTTHDNEICIYDRRSLRLLHEWPSASVILFASTKENGLLLYDRAEKLTKRVEADSLSVVWATDIEKYGRRKLFSGYKVFMTHFLNDEKISCLDWEAGKLLWQARVSDYVGQGFKVDRFIGLHQGRLMVGVSREKEGKIIEINPEKGAFLRTLYSGKSTSVYDKSSDILFNLFHHTYWELNLNTEESKTVDLSLLYPEKRNFVQRLTSFNPEYFFAYNEFEVKEGKVERRYSLLNRKTFEIAWEHECPPILEEEIKHTLPAIFVEGKLHIFWRERLWVYTY